MPADVAAEDWAATKDPSPHQALLQAIAWDYPSISIGMGPHWAGRCSLFARKWERQQEEAFARVASPHLSLEEAVELARRRLAGQVTGPDVMPKEEPIWA